MSDVFKLLTKRIDQYISFVVGSVTAHCPPQFSEDRIQRHRADFFLDDVKQLLESQVSVRGVLELTFGKVLKGVRPLGYVLLQCARC